MERRIIIIVFIIVAVGAAGSLYYYSNHVQSTKTRIPLYLQWMGFNNFTALVNYSDHIVVADVVGIENTGTSKPMPYTMFKIQVLEYIKNPDKLSNMTLLVGQPGVETADSITEPPDSPLMKVGDNVILFLEQQTTGGVHNVFGIPGPWGRYYVKDGRVYSIDLIYAEVYDGGKLSTHVDGVALADFTAQIKSIVG
jgi:hypothetical protein